MADSFLDRMTRSSHLSGSNVGYIEALYESFLDNPDSVERQGR